MLKKSKEFAPRLRKEMLDDPEKAMARLLQEMLKVATGKHNRRSG